MKEYKKIAKDFCKNRASERKVQWPLIPPANFDNEAIDVELGYIEGFLKAREMALIEYKEIYLDRKCFYDSLDNLGEKEV